MRQRNRLSKEASPYLQQHKDNPVHWQPWNSQTLAHARETGRPILLSIGYAACHWCHVMARECFADPEVAELMNRYFINIKVDREERPDIDQIYMAALVASGEQGGWPLTMFLTPGARPIWGGTYFPKRSRYGRPGFLDVLTSVHEAWQNRRDALETGASALHSHIEKHLAGSDGDHTGSISLVRLGAEIKRLRDPEQGGIRGAPKFPNFPLLRAMWLAALETGDRSAAESVAFDLRKMTNGGIYDHVGGGLSRYATDERWIVPHFEKMLYDNAQLLQLLFDVAPYFHQSLFRHRIDRTIEWLEREMLTPAGAFASSIDADSGGEEGRFYLWDPSEIDRLLGEHAEAFFEHYQLESPAGWHGLPVLVRRDHHRDDTDKVKAGLEILRLHRERRTRPARDGKALLDWNGMIIRALADGARLAGNEHWLGIAQCAFASLTSSADKAGRLPHSILGAARSFPGLSSDYAALINAAVSLYLSTQDRHYIELARRWVATLIEDHGDENGGFFLTAAHADDLPFRIRGDSDDATPSATAQIVEAMVRLGAATGDIELHERAGRCAAGALGRKPLSLHGAASLICSAYLATSHRKLVTVDGAEGFLATVARSIPDPRRIDISLKLGDQAETNLIPGVQQIDSERPSAWLCTLQTCLPPIHGAEELEMTLRRDIAVVPDS